MRKLKLAMLEKWEIFLSGTSKLARFENQASLRYVL